MKKRVTKAFGVALIALLLCAVWPTSSQASFILWDEGSNHNELDWKYVETEHFIIYYYPEVEMTARYLYKVAEDIYESNARIFNYEVKDKINVTIIDTEDYTNGFAAHQFNWITLWTTNLYYPFRGRTNWLDDVFSHELGHIISLKAGSKFRENMFGVLIGGSRTSRKYNFDAGVGVLYGSENLPIWMVEGASQYSSLMYGADLYDTNREMLMRMAVLEDNLMSLDSMDIIYDKNSLQGEMCYNQAFNINSWIAENWGLDMNAKMWHEAGLGAYPTYHRMVKKELGMDRETMYNKWKAYLVEKYNKQVANIIGNEAKGFKLRLFDNVDPPEDKMTDEDRWLEGIANLYVQYSPNGEWISVASSHGGQRFGQRLYIKKTKPDPAKVNESKPRKVDALFSIYSWAPDSKKIVFPKYGEDEYRHYGYADLWVYDVEKKESTQITHMLRATDPSWSPDGDKIAFIINTDGQQKLAVMRYPKLQGHYLILDFDDMTQIGPVSWSPDGTKLVFNLYRHNRQDIWMVDADGANLHPLTYDDYDDRDPVFSPDGKSVFFVSDRTGIFNVYRMDLAKHEIYQITDVLGGALLPSVKGDGTSITYSYFTAWGFRAYEIPQGMWKNKKVEDFVFNVTDEEVKRNLTLSDQVPEIKGQDYSVFNGFAQLFPILKDHRGVWVWIPIVNYDDSRLQVGAQVLMADAVDKNIVFMVVYVGEDQRYSVFYENYMLPVTTFLSLHRIFPSIATDFEFFDFDVKANFDASFYFIGFRYKLFKYDMSLFYSYQDIRVEQPSQRVRQISGRGLNLSMDYDDVPQRDLDASINPRGGKRISATVTYASPRLHEPFTGTPMGTDLADFYSDPAVTSIEEARHYPDQNYLLEDYGYVQAMVNYKLYLPMPFWDLTKLNDSIPIKNFDWEKANFERWKRARHTLAIKGMFGYTHSTVPEGYGYGNSFGRVNFYDRFHGGGMYVTGLGAYSDNGAFLGYENYSLEGETMGIVGLDYRFPLIKEIDRAYWAFYFDKLYMAFFANTGNYWSHVNSRKDMNNLNMVFDKSGDGKFKMKDDLISDAGVEFRMSMYLFLNNWDSFIKVAHGFQDREKEQRPFRFYIGLGTGFDD